MSKKLRAVWQTEARQDLEAFAFLDVEWARPWISNGGLNVVESRYRQVHDYGYGTSTLEEVERDFPQSTAAWDVHTSRWPEYYDPGPGRVVDVASLPVRFRATQRGYPGRLVADDPLCGNPPHHPGCRCAIWDDVAGVWELWVQPKYRT